METKEMNLEGYAHSEGVEVKVSAARVNITILLYLFFFVVGAVVLFNYIWGDGLELWRRDMNWETLPGYRLYL